MVKIGICGPVGSGKTALIAALVERLKDEFELGVITNDIYTYEDANFLTKNCKLESARIIGVQTGGCPHTAIREDASMNLEALEQLCEDFPQLEVVFVESGGDNLSASFSPALADFVIFVIDVAGGDKIPRKGGPGITRSDLLLINKIDLAEFVGANLETMKQDALKMRSKKPFIFSNLKSGTGLDELIKLLKERVLF